MADITANAKLMYSGGDCERTVLVSVRNATAADTVNVSQWLSVVKRAGLVSDTGTTIASFAAAANGPSGTPTVLTVPAGPSQDGIWLIAVGVAAP